jgi:zinc protease
MSITTDRTLAPGINPIEDVALIQANKIPLGNGIPVYVINAGSQDLSRIEFLFDAGKIKQTNPLVASFTNDLLDDGTSSHNANQLADLLDQYGSFYESETLNDLASVSLFSLNKHLASTLPVMEEIIKDAVFPQQELDLHARNQKQKFIVSMQKVNTICRMKFNTLLFGDAHPYGSIPVAEDFDAIQRSDIEKFYKSNYRGNMCSIVVSGKIDQAIIKLLDKHFGQQDWMGASNGSHAASKEIVSAGERINFVHKDDALQSAIRIGRLFPTKKHPDYLPFQVLNTVLGGYFGSRLMANIREDKGYTYGIGSGAISNLLTGSFFIATEVGADVCASAVSETYKEIKKLREELVPAEELQLVKSYMLGSFLGDIDGPFALADRFKGIHLYGLGYEYYDRMLKTIRGITSEEIRELANKYLQEEDLIELVVGKK